MRGMKILFCRHVPNGVWEEHNKYKVGDFSIEYLDFRPG